MTSYESFESLGAHHPGEVSLTVDQAEDRERKGIPLPIGGDAETDHAKELLAIGRARRTIRATGHIFRDTGGLDEDGDLWDASFHCQDCDLYYSWPVTPGLAANDDPKQTEMLALVDAHTPRECREVRVQTAIQDATELAKALAGEFATSEGQVRERQAYTKQKVQELVEHAATKGYSTPISGDPVVTLQEAMDRGAVTVTKGLPTAVVWRRANPGLAKAHAFPTPVEVAYLAMWPDPSHQALTDSMKALAGVQRRLMIGGRLPVRSAS